MKRCLKCVHCYADVNMIPHSCDYGVTDGAYPIHSICEMTGRKIKPIKEASSITIRR